jgi:hypothetical protein
LVYVEARQGQYEDDVWFGFGNGERIELSCEIDRAAGMHLRESPFPRNNA